MRPRILEGILPSGRRGISVVEALLMLSVAAATASIVVPTAAKMMKSAKMARVKMELNAVSTGLAEYNRDIGHYPGLDRGQGRPAGPSLVLVSGGRAPDVSGTGSTAEWLRAQRLSLARFLTTSEGSPGTEWQGPYLSHNITADPWGRAYLVNLGAAADEPAQAIYALSAGPDGVVQTPFRQNSSGARVWGDDIAVRLQ